MADMCNQVYLEPIKASKYLLYEIRKSFEDVDLSILSKLKQEVTVFVDNSHQSFMNTDVTTFVLDILPKLQRGVLVNSMIYFYRLTILHLGLTGVTLNNIDWLATLISNPSNFL